MASINCEYTELESTNREDTELENTNSEDTELESTNSETSQVYNLLGDYKNYRRKATITVFLVSLTLAVMGGILCIVAFTVPESSSGYIYPFNGSWFWGFFGTALGLWGTFLFLILIGIYMVYFTRAFVSNFHAWDACPTLLSWSKDSYTQSEWDQYLEEEFGPSGRATFRCDGKKTLQILGAWVCLAGGLCGFFAFKLWVGHGAKPVGSLPFGAFVVVVGFSVSTGVIILYLVSSALAVAFKHRRAANGPGDFKATADGLYWNDNLIAWHVNVPSFFLKTTMVEDIRVKSLPTTLTYLEVCTSTIRKKNKYYFFHRIPIPQHAISQAYMYVNRDHVGVHNKDCWNHQEDYALDWENVH